MSKHIQLGYSTINKITTSVKPDENTQFINSLNDFILKNKELIEKFKNYLAYKQANLVKDGTYTIKTNKYDSYFLTTIKLNSLSIYTQEFIFDKNTSNYETKDSPALKPLFTFEFFLEKARILKLDITKFIHNDSLKATFIFDAFKHFINKDVSSMYYLRSMK